MKIRSFAAVVALLVAGFSAAPSRAQQTLTPADITKIKADVAAAAQLYLKTFNTLDAKAVAEKVWANPGVASDAKGVTILSQDKIIAMYEQIYGALAKANYDHSVMTKDPTVCVLSQNDAIMSASFQRITKSGASLLATTASYWYKKTADGWRLNAILSGGMAHAVTCD